MGDRRAASFARDEDGEIERGPNWGNPRIFCESDDEFERLLAAMPAAYGFENAGPRPANASSRDDQGQPGSGARGDLRRDCAGTSGPASTSAESRRRPTTRTRSPRASRTWRQARRDAVSSALSPEAADVQIIVSDGLSAEAVHHNIPDLLPVLLDGLDRQRISVGQPMLAPYGRVKLAEAVGEALRPSSSSI